MCIYRGGRKPKTMTSMVEEEYLDPSMTTNENEVMNDNGQREIIIACRDQSLYILNQFLFETISFYDTIFPWYYS